MLIATKRAKEKRGVASCLLLRPHHPKNLAIGKTRPNHHVQHIGAALAGHFVKAQIRQNQLGERLRIGDNIVDAADTHQLDLMRGAALFSRRVAV